MSGCICWGRVIGAQVMPEPEAEESENDNADYAVGFVEVGLEAVKVVAYLYAEPCEEVTPGYGTEEG